MDDADVQVDCVIPRPTAWISCVVLKESLPLVALLDGYNVVTEDPPIFYCSSSALPLQMLQSIKATKKCSLSIATVHDIASAKLSRKRRDSSSTFSSSTIQGQLSFSELSLKATSNHPDEFPPMVESSPIRMGCQLFRCVELGNDQSMLLLQVEYMFIQGDVLTPPSDNMLLNAGSRQFLAKIEAQLIQPLVSLGNGKFGTLGRFFSLYRPRKSTSQQWETLAPIPLQPPIKQNGAEAFHPDVEHDFRHDGPRFSRFGYNPFKAIVMPRPIGWISTFRKEGRIPHLAPYSFFCQVGSEHCPMVAFSAYGPQGSKRKDAAQDAEDMKCFVYNLVSEDLLEPMNLSAAEMLPDESEFKLSQLHPQSGSVVVDAPIVQEAHVRMECEYITTVENIGGFSIVVGKVVHIAVDKAFLLADGTLDVQKLKPVARLGYADEYGVVTNLFDA